jgi:hypothetical protein
MSRDEQELIIRVNAGDPDFVEVDVTYPKFRRQLERWGFKPIETDPSGGARFRISIKQLKPMSRRKSGASKPMTAAQKKKAVERMAKAREAKE